MKTRCLDHIDLRVRDMEVARKFYRKFLPHLGFVHESPGDDFHTFYSAGGDKPSEFFGFTEDRNHHQTNADRILGRHTRRSGSARKNRARNGRQNAGRPEICEDYSPGYYAFFFEDPDGNKLENLLPGKSPIIAQ
jgi:catechol 2,3-dioxygenase-like lactoylglutathione lyase family enzyme